MASNENLEIRIGADVKDLNKGLKQASKDVQKFEKSVKKGSTATGKLGKGAANATPALQEFSRVIQDAPFGIQGVANNITQLTSQFGYLQKSAGGTKAALKGMIGALTGPAGILLAVSAVTSLMVSYGDEIANVIKGNSKLEASQKAVNEALSEFYGGSVTKLQSYVKLLENSNTTEEERIRITDELIKKVPSLTKQDFDYGNNLDVVRSKIGSYVLAQASRIEADTLVEENSEKLAKKAQITQIKAIKDEEARVKALTKFLIDEGEKVTKASATQTYIAGGRITDVNKTKAEILTQFNDFANELETELKPVQEKIDQLYGATFSGGLDDNNKGSKKGGGGAKRDKITSLLNLPTAEETGKELSKWLEVLKENAGIEKGLGVDLINADGVTAEMDKWSANFQSGTEPILSEIQAFKEQTAILANGIASTFSGIGTAIGEGMVNGGNIAQSATQALVAGLGGMISAMGDYLIAAGAASIAASLLTSTFGVPGAGVASGLKAVAVGTGLKVLGGILGAGAAAVGSGGGGGSASSGSDTGGNYSSSSTSRSSVGSGGGTYVFEIAGTKLVGVLQNTLTRNKALGGSLTLDG